MSLLVWDAHSKIFRSGNFEILIEIRERYCLIKWRKTVKIIIKGCILCKRFYSSSWVQTTAPLPVSRIEQSSPFSAVSIDFGWTIHMKCNDEQNYNVLFTCRVTRALHLQFIRNMAAKHSSWRFSDSFLVEISVLRF